MNIKSVKLIEPMNFSIFKFLSFDHQWSNHIFDIILEFAFFWVNYEFNELGSVNEFIFSRIFKAGMLRKTLQVFVAY